MIEVTTKTIEGVRFIADIKVLEPDEQYMGVPVHHIEEGVDTEILRALKALGFRKVGKAAFYFDVDLYAEGRLLFLRAIVNRSLLRVYWAAVRWLYDNARVFKQIPEGSRFSWSYFTPYCWYLNAKARF